MNRGTLARLRDIVPIRPLSQGEAMRIAELQATRLLEMSGITEPALPESVISGLPRVDVKRISPWPVSGCTDWAKGTWVIVVNGGESPNRQRFTLCHEFKHILDHRFVDVLYTGSTGAGQQRRIETVCDYFAGCLLVPKVWLRRAWSSGYQDPADLSELFCVSQAAIQTRLLQTGLVEPPRRGMETAAGWLYSREGEEFRQLAQAM